MSKTKSAYANLPEELHRQLKVKLAKDGKTIQQFILQAVKEYLKK